MPTEITLTPAYPSPEGGDIDRHKRTLAWVEANGVNKLAVAAGHPAVISDDDTEVTFTVFTFETNGPRAGQRKIITRPNGEAGYQTTTLTVPLRVKPANYNLI